MENVPIKPDRSLKKKKRNSGQKESWVHNHQKYLSTQYGGYLPNTLGYEGARSTTI